MIMSKLLDQIASGGVSEKDVPRKGPGVLPEDVPTQMQQVDFNEQIGSLVMQISGSQKEITKLRAIIKDLRKQLEKK